MKKKRFLGFVFTLALVLGLLPGMSLTAYADSEWTEVGTAEALQTAVNNNTTNIKLTADIDVSTLDNGYGDLDVSDKQLTLDLNGHTLSSNGSSFGTIYVEGNADITIVDNSESGDGSVKNNSTNGSAILQWGGKLTVSGGSITGSWAGIMTYGGTLTVSGGNVIGKITGVYAGEYSEGYTTNATVSGGTITGKYAIQARNTATLTVSGGTVKSVAEKGFGIFATERANVCVNGGEITCEENGNGAIFISGGELNISGGVITSSKSDAISVSGTASVEMSNGTVSGFQYLTDDDEDTRKAGVILYENASFTMTGGVVKGGSGVDLRANSTFTMKGGYIEGGYGALLNHTSKFKLSEGWINGGIAVCANAGTTFDMTGGTVKGAGGKKIGILAGGTAEDNAGCTATVSGGHVMGDLAFTTRGGGVLKISGGAWEGKLDTWNRYPEITGGIFTDNEVRWAGGNTTNPLADYVSENYALVNLTNETYHYGVGGLGTVTVVPNTNTKLYDGNGITLTATPDLTVTANDVTYNVDYTGEPNLTTFQWAKDDTTIEDATGSSYTTGKDVSDSGTYKCTVTFSNKKTEDDRQTASNSVTVTINKADPTANAPSGLTATYGQTLADVTLTNPEGNTPGTWVWRDSTQSVGNAGNNTFKADFTPTDAVNYNSKSDIDVTVTVSKAANPATVTNTATVTKGGNTVDLASNVTLNGATGTVSYEISGETNGCSLTGSTLTSGENAGTVTVNVTVAEDSNYNALAATTITVTISDKGTQTITASDMTATYGDTGKKVEASTSGDGTLSYAVKSGDAVTVDASTGALTIKKVGTAVITVTAAETNTYAKATKDVTVTVNKATPTVTAPTAKNLTYNEQAQELVTAGTVEGGTMYYAVTSENTAPTDDNLYKTSIPTATNAGTYYVWYKVIGDDSHNESEAKCIQVEIKKATNGLADDEKPQANALTYNGESQPLVTAPEKLPDGYTKIQYSVDGGATWSEEIPTGTESGEYTVNFRYIGDDNHENITGDDLVVKVTIGEAMIMQVDFIILKYNGTRGLPEEIDGLTIQPVIHVKDDDAESISKGLELELKKGMESKVSVENVEFTGKVTDPAPGKYEVTVTGLPKSVIGRDKIYSTDGTLEGPVKWKYDIITRGEINEKDKKIVVTVYLIFDDGSRTEEIKVYALPEDEIGAYKLRDDGTKEYLLFHTYDICMQWLGNDELCRGYERCFHKESPYVNPFVKP